MLVIGGQVSNKKEMPERACFSHFPALCLFSLVLHVFLGNHSRIALS